MMGRIAYLKGKYATAEQFFQKAQSIYEEALGVEHPEVLATINNLADVYVEQGKRRLAEELYKDVLAERLRILGPEHPAVAQTLQRIAQQLYFHGHYEDSE